ncbi:MAG: trigger factor [Clostridia bacterium]|nr:trigger factor [Clostridia bacterium]
MASKFTLTLKREETKKNEEGKKEKVLIPYDAGEGSAEKTGENEYTLTFSVHGDIFESAIVRAYNKMKGRINVPGFRKGKAPRSIIERMYGPEVFHDDAIEDLFPGLYDSLTEQTKLDIVSQPFGFELASAGKDGTEFSVKVSVKPVIELEGYKGIEAEKPELKDATDEEIDAEIDRMRNENARMLDVDDRAARDGDTANIDFEGFVDGVAFDGGKGESHDLVLGSGQFIPGFEEQIVGHNVGDEFDVNVTFPEQYAEELAGKAAVFKVKLNALKLKEIPELDEEFVKDVSEFDTVEELRADVKSGIEKRRAESADRAFENNVLSALGDLVDADIPDAMIQTAIDRNVRDFEYNINMQGIDMKTYLQYFGMDENKLREQYAEKAEKDVKVDLALEKIAELEKIEVSDEDIEAEYEKLASSYGMEIDKVKAAVGADALKSELLSRKASEFVVAAAVAVAPAPEETDDAADEEPAEKPAEAPAEE